MIETKDIELLLGKMISGQPLADAEKERLDVWISQDYENLVMLENLKQSLKDADTADGGTIGALFDKIMAKADAIKRRRKIRTGLLVGTVAAACSVIAILILPPLSTDDRVQGIPAGIILSDNTGYSTDIESLTENAPPADNVRIDRESGTIEFSSPTEDRSFSAPEAKHFSIRVPYARELNVVLPDGTKVWINAGSEISFPEFFDGKSRNVHLKGEAYFDVVHDETQQFIVHTDGVETRVFGTEFLMTAYPDDSRTSVSLVEGSLGVSAGAEQIMLKAGEGLEYDSGRDELSRFVVDKGNVELLRNGLFVFDNAELRTISARLERWYGVEINFEEESLAAMKFFIRIDKYGDIANVLELMKATKRIGYKYSDGKVLFTKPTDR